MQRQWRRYGYLPMDGATAFELSRLENLKRMPPKWYRRHRRISDRVFAQPVHFVWDLLQCETDPLKFEHTTFSELLELLALLKPLEQVKLQWWWWWWPSQLEWTQRSVQQWWCSWWWWFLPSSCNRKLQQPIPKRSKRLT